MNLRALPRNDATSTRSSEGQLTAKFGATAGSCGIFCHISRQDLLNDVVDDLCANGFGDRSLREIASSVGSSHRMLNYHFGTREGLLEAVVNELANRRLDADAELFPLDGRDGLRARWEQLTGSERSHDADRLFFELAAIALRHTQATERFRADYAEPWLEMSARSVENTPIDTARARVVTRLDVAVLRGLLLDLLVTGDDADVEEAFEVYARLRREAIDAAVESMAVGD